MLPNFAHFCNKKKKKTRSRQCSGKSQNRVKEVDGRKTQRNKKTIRQPFFIHDSVAPLTAPALASAASMRDLAANVSYSVNADAEPPRE